MRRFLILPLAALALIHTASAEAAQRCDKTHGPELAHSNVVKIYKVKIARNTYRYYGCAKPRGIVTPLTRSFKGNAVKMVAAKGPFGAFTRTLDGQDTISVVDARTGRQHHGLYPPSDIEFDVDPATPQIGAARVNTAGELVVSYLGLGDGTSTHSKVYVYAFDADGDQQLLDSGSSDKLIAKSIKLSGETVSWTHDGATRTAKIGEVPLSILGGGGPLAGDVTTSPEGGIACHVASAGLSGNCVGSFSPNTYVTITATGPSNSTVTISGACSAVHAPVAGQATSVATCVTRMSKAREATVKFS